MLFLNASAGKTLTIGAAASLTNVMKELKMEFEKDNPNIKLVMTFAATGKIRMQISKGAPIDVFASANRNFGGNGNYGKILNKSSIKIMCTNALVFVAPKNISLLEVKRLGIGNPAYVPAGKYAKKLLESKKLWNKVKDKIIQGSNVRQVLSWLEQGAVDGGFVYATDAAMNKKLKVIKKYTVIDGKKIVYPVAITKSCREKATAKDFIIFLISAKAKKIFRKYGFIIE
jgi:molybdate transport system substrate-binding protein